MTTVSSDKPADAVPECEWMLAISQPCRHSQPTATATSAVLHVRAARAGKCRKKRDTVAVLWKAPALQVVQHAIS